jgi:rfaE bifunctional protein kinase chain/domain
MNARRFQELTGRYAGLRIAVIGDFCLDRYLEIDPTKSETSIETGLPVHNVVRVRSQAGAAGTILANLSALGVGELYPIGFCGVDGEGMELQRVLSRTPGVRMDHFLQTPERRTFTYCKPLLLEPGKAPVELSRLDSKNWTPTPEALEARLIEAVKDVVPRVDAVVVMDQVDLPGTGVMSDPLLLALRKATVGRPAVPVVADCRRGLDEYPPGFVFKMNAAELGRFRDTRFPTGARSIDEKAMALAEWTRRPVFVTLAERGIVCGVPGGALERADAHPVRGPIDIVGAGDAVTANLAAALAAGAEPQEAMELAMAAASVVIHQLGTTGTAAVRQLAKLLGDP